jgi:HAMP domain-containing protein
MDETAVTISGIWFAAAIAALIAVILVAVIWQLGGTSRARAAAARDDAYKDLAGRSTAAQAKTAEELERVAGELADLKSRLASMERLMREVG